MRACIIAASVGFWALGASAADVPLRLERDPAAMFGLVVDEVAKAPQVEHPVAGAFDDDGALYVAEAEPGEPNADGDRYRVTQLLDPDGDGVFDRSFTYAELPASPRSLLWQPDGLYVAAGDTIWKLVDDGVGNVRRTAWRQARPSETTLPSRQTFGPWLLAGELWWGDAGTGIWRARPEGEDELVVRLDPKVATLAAASLIFTPTGEPWLAADFHKSGFPGEPYAALYRLAPGGSFTPGPHALPGEVLPPQSSQAPSRILSRARPFGFIRYTGQTLSPDFQGVWLLHTGKGLRRITLEQRESTVQPVEQTVARVSGEGLLEDADGSVLSFHSGVDYLERGASPATLGAISRLRRAEAPPMHDPRGKELGWDRSQMGDFVVRLTDTRPAVVARAQRELGQTGDFAAYAIKQIIPDWPVPALKQTILWTLAPMRGYAAQALLVEMLGNKDAAVAETAARLVGLRGDASAEPTLQALLQREPPVARAAAEALTRLHALGSVPILLSVAPGAQDPALEFAFLHALRQLATEGQLTAALRESRPFTQRAAALVLYQRQHAGLREALLPWLQSSEPVLLETATWIFGQMPNWPRS